MASKTPSSKTLALQLQIWDTGGQERFRTITQSYYRSAHGVIICYDITSRESFLNVSRWLDDVRRLAASNVVKILVGALLMIYQAKNAVVLQAPSAIWNQNASLVAPKQKK